MKLDNRSHFREGSLFSVLLRRLVLLFAYPKLTSVSKVPNHIYPHSPVQVADGDCGELNCWTVIQLVIGHHGVFQKVHYDLQNI
jgi:hypothetical protein